MNNLFNGFRHITQKVAGTNKIKVKILWDYQAL